MDIEHDKIATLTLDENLDYVYPSGLSKYNYDGDMYELKSEHIQMFVTKNHKLYVKRVNHDEFELLRTHNVFGENVKFKTWASNNYLNIEHFNAKDNDECLVQYNMDAWLKLLGIFIANGYTKINNNCDRIYLSAKKERTRIFHRYIFTKLNIVYYQSNEYTIISSKNYSEIYRELNYLNVSSTNKYFPNIFWKIFISNW